MKTAFIVNISKGTTVCRIGDFLCRQCRVMANEDATGEFMRFLEQEDLLCTTEEDSGMEATGGGEPEKEGGGGGVDDDDDEDDDVNFMDAQDNLDELIGPPSSEGLLPNASQGSQGLLQCMCFHNLSELSRTLLCTHPKPEGRLKSPRIFRFLNFVKIT